MNQDTIYVTGHRNPDSDSIVAAIAYAAFKQRKGEDAVACCLGEPNAETKYLLQRFGFEEPTGLKSISPLPSSFSAPTASRIVLEST